jgi:replicative DNA helicase
MEYSELLHEIKTDERLLIRLVEEFWQEDVRRIGTNKYRCLCHFHNDQNNPNFTIYEKDGEWRYKCFACDASGDAVTFVQEVLGCSFKEALKFIAENYGFDFPEDFERGQMVSRQEKKSGRIYQRFEKKTEEKELKADLNDLWEKCRSAWERKTNEFVDRTLKFLLKRGIEEVPEGYCGVLLPEFVQGSDEFSLWLKEKAEAGYNLVVPIFKDGSVENLVLRDVIGNKPKNRKVLNLPGRSVYPVNLDKIKEDKESLCILCEGITDFLSLVYALKKGGLAPRVAAVTGANIFKEDWAEDFPENVVILYDGDQAGYKGAQKAFKKLKKAGKSPKVALLPAGVDVNDLLVQSSSVENFLKKLSDILRSAVDVPIRSVYTELEDFLDSNGEVSYSVGFLSGVTVIGGLPSGLFVLGGVPGIGKTATAIELALETAKNHPVLFFEQELSAREVQSRFLSRLLAEEGYDVSWAKIYKKSLTEDEQGALRKVVRDKKELLARIYHYDSAANVKEILQHVSDFIEITGEKPVVFIDYLQILEPDKKFSSRREEIARIVYQLSQAAASCEIPIVLLSALSRQAYKASDFLSVMAAGKEAGEIEYATAGLFVLRYFVPEGEYERDGKKLKQEEVVDVLMRQRKKVIEMVVPKVRAGIPCIKYLLFDGERMSICEVQEEQAYVELESVLEGVGIKATFKIPAPAVRSNEQTEEQSEQQDDSIEQIEF